MRSLFIVVFLLPLLLFSQEKGIKFEHNTNWKTVKEKAKAENKYIFVDCFTTWCGPCIWMSENVFPQEKVGDFFNKNFVSLKIQMDQTAKDNDDVKSWYDESKRFEKDYEVRAYPTFLIFNPEGELVHRIVGGGDADDLIAKSRMGMNPETQLVTLIKKYKANPNDADIVLKTAIAAISAYDNDLTNEALARYIQLAGTDALLSKENIQFILPAVNSTNSATFELFTNNMDKAEALLTELNLSFTVNDILAGVIIKDIVMPQVYDEANVSLDFEALLKQLKNDFPSIDTRRYMLHVKGEYFRIHKNWPGFKDVVNEIISTQDTIITSEMLNQFAYTIFENCDDLACLQSALLWSEKSLNPIENPRYLDTYANLLYKSGDVKNAVLWQEKAIKSASESEREQFEETLSKMKAGKPTWN